MYRISRISAIAVALLLAAFAAPARAQWQDIQPAGLGSTVWGIDFLDEDNGWLVGWSSADSDIGRTSDGGRTWQGSNVSSTFLFSVLFTDASTGYISGYDGGCGCGLLLSTRDGGTTWQTRTFPNDSPTGSFGFYKVRFTDPSTGFLSGYDGAILKTTDAGATWKRTETGTADLVFRVLTFADATVGYAVAGTDFSVMNRIYKSTDAGENWALINDYSGTHSIGGLRFLDAQTGFMAGNSAGAAIFKTIDGGVTWSRVYTGAADVVLQEIDFVDRNIGYAVGNGGTIVATTDGGETWNVEPAPTDQVLTYVHALPSGTVYAGGFGGVLLKRTSQAAVREADEAEGAALTFAPNPFTRSATLRLNGLTGRSTVVISDLLGRELQRVESAGGGDVTIERADLSPGTYLYRVLRDGAVLGAGTLGVR